jgi:hypothetical protein
MSVTGYGEDPAVLQDATHRGDHFRVVFVRGPGVEVLERLKW